MEVVVHKRKNYTHWSLEATSMLVALFQAGCSMDEMMEALDRPAPKIRARLSRLNLKLSARQGAPDREAFERIMQAAEGVDQKSP